MAATEPETLPVAASGESAAEQVAAPKKKKNKKKKNKKKKPVNGGTAEQVEEARAKQTDPPTVPVVQLFDHTPSKYPAGEIMEYAGDEGLRRVNGEEFRAIERANRDWIDELRLGAEVHRQVRYNAQKHIKPGMLLSEVAELVEDTARVLIGEKGLKAGLGFPCGTSINHCAAHFTANPGDMDVLKTGDVMKVDFGVHIKGRIIDCAWTWCDDPEKQPLLDAVRAATNAGVKAAGIDVRLSDIGAEIQEVMESHEIEIDGTVYPIRPVENLCGHSIEPYIIHAGKSVPIVGGRGSEYRARMEEGEVYAIETFGTTGAGTVNEVGKSSHFMIDPDMLQANVRSKAGRNLLNTIQTHFGTMAFCPRWLERLGVDYRAGLTQLVRAGVVREYPPLDDIVGSYVAQYEHTILLKPTAKEVVTRGTDF